MIPFNLTVSNVVGRKILLVNSNTIIMTFRCVAIFFSILNMSVLAHSKLKDTLYKFLLAMAVSDFLYSGLIFALSIFARLCYVGDVGPTGYFVFLVLYILISEFITSCLAFFNIKLEIFLTLQRIVIISNNTDSFLKTSKYKYVCSFLMAVTATLYTPMLYMNEITRMEFYDESSNATLVDYRLVKTEFSRGRFALNYVTSLNTTRIALVTLVFLVFNIAAIVKFRAYLMKKFYLKEITSKFTFYHVLKFQKKKT
jgi:hypothetical protein